jgi:hypothetical protein
MAVKQDSHPFFHVGEHETSMLEFKKGLCRLAALTHIVDENDYGTTNGLYSVLVSGIPNIGSKMDEEYLDNLGDSIESRIVEIDAKLDNWLNNALRIPTHASYKPLFKAMDISKMIQEDKILMALRCFSRYSDAIMNLLQTCIRMHHEIEDEVEENDETLSNIEEELDAFEVCLNDNMFTEDYNEAFESILTTGEHEVDIFDSIIEDGININLDELYSSSINIVVKKRKRAFIDDESDDDDDSEEEDGEDSEEEDDDDKESDDDDDTDGEDE